MVIEVRDIAFAANTAEQGTMVFQAILMGLDHSDEVTISFAGVKTASSSFVNVAFVGLLTHYSLDEIKRRVRVVQSTRQINDLIKALLERAAQIPA